ncbi:RNA polymerase sigma factor [Chitinophaga lutea]
MKNYADHQLIALLQQDSEPAFREIYDRHWKSLYETAWRKTSAEDAGDLVQEIFLYLWKNRAQIQIQAQLNTYLHAALRHKIIDFYRLESARGVYHAQLFPAGSFPANDYEVKELNAVIQAAIRKMPERMRQIFVLNRDGGLPSAEIARQLSLSDQTVRNQISTAIRRVRTAVERYLSAR